MAGGTVIIEGNAGDATGGASIGAVQGMAGGTVIIEGNAGDATGGASIGAVQGMAGGTVLVLGNAGDRTANLMRRGLVVVRALHAVSTVAAVLLQHNKVAGFHMCGSVIAVIAAYHDKPAAH